MHGRHLRQFGAAKSLSFRGGPAFLAGNSTFTLSKIHPLYSVSLPSLQGCQHSEQEHVTLHNESRRGPDVRRVGRNAQRFNCKYGRNALSYKASRSQYMACQTAASVSRLGASSGRLPPSRKMVMIGGASASRALVRGAFMTFLVLAPRSTTSTYIRKCRASSRQEWPPRTSCPQRLFSCSST
jgi:hypothetical protein